MPTRRFLLISIQPHTLSDDGLFEQMSELESLVNSYQGKVVDVLVQKREVHDKGMYIGRGKIEAAKQHILDHHIDVVVLNAIAKPGHLYELREEWTKVKPDIEVWDRVDLILHIFALHAHTAEARLQIELAAMRHMGPRIFGMGEEMSRQGGGIGGRGIGETNTERMKRHWAVQMKRVEERLTKLTNARERQMDRRRKAGLLTVSLIGYTNAGKTSLYNLLTGKQKTAQNALFVTLDASVGKLYLPDSRQEVLVSDTIGFIQNLPAELVNAFRSTLMEALHADLLLQVVDASDPRMVEKLEVVDAVLRQLNLHNKPRMLVFNKIDACSPKLVGDIKRQFGGVNVQFVSVVSAQGIPELLQQMSQTIATPMTV